MNSLKLLVAAFMLSQPESMLEMKDPNLLLRDLGPALRELALQWELMDPRETHLFSNPADFKSDLKTLQTRYTDLASAPLVSEAARFPSREVVNELMSFNRSYRQDLNSRLSLDLVHTEEVRAALLETDHLYRIWDCVRDARCDYYYVTVRRQALKQLRELLGDPAFYSGTLPPHIPVWRLARME